MKRLLLLLVAAGFCGPVLRAQDFTLQPVPGEPRTVRDPLYAVSLTFPRGWAVKMAERWGSQETTIFFETDKSTASAPSFYYRLFATPMVLTTAGYEAWLAEQVQKKTDDRRTALPDYALLPNSYVITTIGGRPALAWAADFTLRGAKWVEYFTRLVTEKGTFLFFMKVPAADFEALRKDFDAMIQTVRVP